MGLGIVLLTVAGCGGPVCRPATWTNMVNLAASGSTLTKKLGGDDWNASAISNESVTSGNIAVEAIVDSLTDYKMFGLSHNDVAADFSDIDYAIDIQGDATLSVWESGIHVPEAGGAGFKIGDVFRVSVESGVVKYYQNGVSFYTSKVAPTYPLFADTSIWTQGAKLTVSVCR